MNSCQSSERTLGQTARRRCGRRMRPFEMPFEVRCCDAVKPGGFRELRAMQERWSASRTEAAETGRTGPAATADPACRLSCRISETLIPARLFPKSPGKFAPRADDGGHALARSASSERMPSACTEPTGFRAEFRRPGRQTLERRTRRPSRRMSRILSNSVMAIGNGRNAALEMPCS